MRHPARAALVVFLLGALNSIAAAQTSDADTRTVIAVADSVLVALTTSDTLALARLTIDSAVVGGTAERNGVERRWLTSWTSYIHPKGPLGFTERGFDATARVQDHMAQVWVPYDLYVGEKWSHCGVDAFTLMKSEGRWRVASLIYTIEQPPACRMHPSGPPKH